MTWTSEDAQRAAKEGWRKSGAYVSRKFDDRGLCPFSHESQIVEHLYEQSATSAWHREVYLSLPWTIADATIANRQGVIVYRSTVGSIPVPRYRVFKSDEEARAFVDRKAEEGDPLYVKLVATLTKRRLGVKI